MKHAAPADGACVLFNLLTAEMMGIFSGSRFQTYKVKARPQPDVRPHMRLCRRETSREVSEINSGSVRVNRGGS
ncbi:hypothetical protein VTO73DRAFT_9064 [Trametes versicolor]